MVSLGVLRRTQTAAQHAHHMATFTADKPFSRPDIAVVRTVGTSHAHIIEICFGKVEPIQVSMAGETSGHDKIIEVRYHTLLVPWAAAHRKLLHLPNDSFESRFLTFPGDMNLSLLSSTGLSGRTLDVRWGRLSDYP
jgi:hypothetical protein